MFLHIRKKLPWIRNMEYRHSKINDMASENNKKKNSRAPYKTINIDNVQYKTYLTEKFKNRQVYLEKDPKKVLAFMPGTIKRVFIKKGDKVKYGSRLLVLDAMKMNNRIHSPLDGVIKEVHIEKGDLVAKHALLLEFE